MTPTIEREVAKRFASGVPLIRLEAYYYATLPGDKLILDGEFKADMAFKCHLCGKNFMNNLDFVKHLCLHINSEASANAASSQEGNAAEMLSQCKYCYLDFDTDSKLEKHMSQEHFAADNLEERLCRICEMSFGNSDAGLIHHMSDSHVRTELPYSCGVCGFRSSFPRAVIDHFQEAHDRTDKLQCPHCLKMFALYKEYGYSSQVAVGFLNHLLQHKNSGVKNLCRKCRLKFITAGELKTHVEKDHLSYRNFKDVEAYNYPGGERPIDFPSPNENFYKYANRKSHYMRFPTQQSTFAQQNLEDLAFMDVDSEQSCHECGKKLHHKSHYPGTLCCTKCRFSTCCGKAMSKHYNTFHAPLNNGEFNLGSPSILEHDLFCCCGFKTNSGNKMAKHLALNKCTSAYKDEDEAKKNARALTSASFPTLVSLDDEAENNDDLKDADGDIDPSLLMAQVYMESSKKTLEASSSSSKTEKAANNEGESGPLAFLGLSQKSSESEDVEMPSIQNVVSLNSRSNSPKVNSKDVEETSKGDAEKPSNTGEDISEEVDIVDEVSNNAEETSKNTEEASNDVEESPMDIEDVQETSKDKEEKISTNKIEDTEMKDQDEIV